MVLKDCYSKNNDEGVMGPAILFVCLCSSEKEGKSFGKSERMVHVAMF